MKKLFLILSVVFSLSVLGSCGHSEADYKAVYDKIENDEELTPSDYDLMLDYVDDALSASKKIKDLSELAKFGEKYPYTDKFMYELMYGDPSDEVKKKINDKVKNIYKSFENIESSLSDKSSSLGGDDEDDEVVVLEDVED